MAFLAMVESRVDAANARQVRVDQIKRFAIFADDWLPSHVCSLEPGGVGVFSGLLLQQGERVCVEIEGIGAIENPVVTEPSIHEPAGPRDRKLRL
jgi:hypothetical protein